MDIGFTLEGENPKSKANALSILFFGWLLPIIKRGINHSLSIKDLCQILDKDKSEDLADNLEEYWENELCRAKEKKCKPSLLKPLMKLFSCEFLLYGILWFYANVILISLKPIFLAQLIILFNKEKSPTRNVNMYLYSTGLILVSIVSVFCIHHTNFAMQAIGMRIRTSTSSLIYRKITRLNQKALGQTAAGKIVNLLSNDVNRFDLVLPTLHTVWVMPFQLIVLLLIVWNQVGVSSLVGIVSMVLLTIPIQGFLTKYVGRLRTSISKKTDNRVKLMSEIISGIQVIKMYAWENAFEKLIRVVRAVEMKVVTSASYLRGVYSGCTLFVDKLAVYFTLVCYICLGNYISAEKVFTVAQTYNVLRVVMGYGYPLAVSIGAESWISIKRLQEFLLMEERAEDVTEDADTNGVVLSNVYASWTDTGNTLRDININVRSGTLCAIVGPVGAGKSSILQLLLGELPTKCGRIQIGGDVSYSSQEPWLFQSTVRNNILFGQRYERKRYKKIVKVCALEKDFEQFPHGDRTIVGEKGVSLSGGQRARINLARAVYRQADIYLLDDPLSAVDTQVGKQLFDQCIHHYLQQKTRILVTHQLQYLKKADLIVVVNNGVIEAQGSFDELLENTTEFAKLLVSADETDLKQDYIIDSESEVSDISRRHSTTVSMRKKSDSSHTDLTGMSMSWSDLSDCFDVAENNQFDDEESGNDPNAKPFKNYILSVRNSCVLISLFLLLIVSQGLTTTTDQWVTYWSNEEQMRHLPGSFVVLGPPNEKAIEPYYLNITGGFNTDQTPPPLYRYDSKGIYDSVLVHGKLQFLIKTTSAIYLYTALIISSIIFIMSRTFLFFKACMMSSMNLHSEMFNSLLKAPMRFFDTNPSGRILNRFSKDMGAIDEVLPRALHDAVALLLLVAGILVNIAVSSPVMVIAIVILGIVFIKFNSWYILTAKVLKHVEGIAKSPVFSHVNSTLNGMATIRACKAEEMLREEFDHHQDVHTSAWYLTIACINCFGLWLDLIAIVFLAVVTYGLVILDVYSNVNGSLAGLAISQCMALTGMLQYGMRQTAEVINQMTSVERILQYTKLDQEGPFESPKGKSPKENWPRRGRIEFRNLSLKYVENEPPVLNNLNFFAMPGEKIGIVGRTGAGKSSLTAALFRLTTIEGSIFIDGVDTTKLGLTDLRKRISIIPQEPVLFSESLRYNLDPLGEYDDRQIWDVLEQVEMKDVVNSLDFKVAEGGSNFSLGQRQLLCLARAILKNNKILILDEATANVDHRTDALIQLTIRKRFKNCTVLTIAHRLNTIMDSDKVLVMSYGNIVEFDHPHKLLQTPDGHFHNLVSETGPSMSAQLKNVAKMAYDNK
ncbi:ATP-binding cassette subfamily C member 4-like isoform X1 [Diorhabda sublineata]|uniref:ATP-binding cassette subfamily C member 4-like isoform X1 n=2 Tax=Diorhabda sublineata TaxID=1163346 RepID=UPI0024E14DE5|nr:ATP-binding cassette subfamily C member 4-like isoform X1 [Diorhabda sublineata]